MSEPLSSKMPEPKYFQPMSGPGSVGSKEKPAEKAKPAAMNLDAVPTSAAPVTMPPATSKPPTQSVDFGMWSTAMLEREVKALHLQRAKDPKSFTAADKERLLKAEAELTKKYAKETPPTLGPVTPLPVQVCERPADLPTNSIWGIPHKWIKTQNKEAGMGLEGGGVPGHEGGPTGYPGAPTTINDHAGEEATSCLTLSMVDVECVDRELEIGKATGAWIPPFNDCHTVAADIVMKCAINGVDPYAYEHNKESDAGVP